MSEKINIAIIGGGIIGCCLAFELAKNHEDICVFEKNPGITKGENQSSRNSGVLHAGIYYEQDIRPLKGRLCVEGNRLWVEFAQKHQLPCKQTPMSAPMLLCSFPHPASLIPPRCCTRFMLPPVTAALFLCPKPKSWI
jgi:L-2-hydroxyglutarate oxidase LhgO